MTHENWANSTNMFVNKYCAINETAAPLSTLNFASLENGCLSMLDTVIGVGDPAISQNVTGMQDQSLFDISAMHEDGPEMVEPVLNDGENLADNFEED